MAAQPEWRHDLLTGRRVLISPARAERPIRSVIACPFCEGHEAETPPEVLAHRDAGSLPNGPGWRVRVVPNRYAAVSFDGGGRTPLLPQDGSAESAPGETLGNSNRPAAAEAEFSRHASTPGLGVAEVFLECPHHETAFRNLPVEHAADVIRAWRDRLRFWRADGRLAFAQVFKNEGPAAGASVEHCHSQLIGIPFVPPAVADELRRAAVSDCPFCRWIDSERAGVNFVAEWPGFIALCPPAPRFPGETWVLPTGHAEHFEDLTDSTVGDLAIALLDLLSRIDRAFGGPDYNLIVKSAPFRHAGRFHWRIEILLRTTTMAGWEWGTGMLINTMFPERAAELLR